MHVQYTKVLKFAVLLVITSPVNAQGKYWVDQSDATEKILSDKGFESQICSDWINACSYYLSAEERDYLRAAGLNVVPVQRFLPARQKLQNNHKEIKYGFTLEQIEAELMIERGLTGKGVQIGIIDGGFLHAETDPSLSHFFEEGKVLGAKDYLFPDQSLFDKGKGPEDSHGREVWQLIGGANPQKGIQYGLATGATYYLARTDHLAYEKRLEEDLLIQAMEWLDREGVRIINISLGYNIGFNNPEENYTTDQMDGKTTAIARAVEYAIMEKGILVVVAAGNEDNNSRWRIVSTPGDAAHALTVGASKLDIWEKMHYSSIGPEFVSYIKPDVIVFSSSGTSFTAPIITGLAACMMEYDTSLTNLEVIEIIQKSGHCYPYGNNYVGYGVPTCGNILKLLDGKEDQIQRPLKIATSRKTVLLDRVPGEGYAVTLHKKGDKNVIERVVHRPMWKKLKIKKTAEATKTTVLTGKSVIEVVWE